MRADSQKINAGILHIMGINLCPVFVLINIAGRGLKVIDK